MKENEPNNRCNAILEIEGSEFKKRRVCNYSYEFNQAFDTDNQPTAVPRGGTIYVQVDAFSHEENPDLLNWMLRPDMKKNGKITIYKPSDPNIVLKTIEFKDAYCVYYKEIWKDLKAGTTDATNTEEIKIVWKKFKVGSVGYEY